MTDDVNVRLQLQEQAKFNSEVDESAKKVEGIGDSAERGADKGTKASGKFTGGLMLLKKAVKVVALAFVGLATAGVAAFTAAAKNSITTVVDLAKSTASLARITGLSERRSSQWVQTAKLFGVESKGLNMGFISLAKNMRAANGGSEKQINLFRRLGVSQDAIRRGDTSQVIFELADAFARMKNPGEKAAIVQELFGRSGQTMGMLLDKGSGPLRDQLALVQEYGATLDKKGVRQALRLAKAQQKLKLATLGLKVTLATALIPQVRKATEFLSGFLKHINMIVNDDSITSQEKWARVGRFILRTFESLWRDTKGLTEQWAPAIMHAFVPAFANIMGEVALVAAQQAPETALQFVNAFIHANVWGQIGIGLFLIHQLNLLGPLLQAAGAALGRKTGISFGSSFAKHAGIAITGFFIGFEIGRLFAPQLRAAFTDVLNWMIDKINWVIGKANKLPGVDIGKVGHVDFRTGQAGAGGQQAFAQQLHKDLGAQILGFHGKNQVDIMLNGKKQRVAPPPAGSTSPRIVKQLAKGGIFRSGGAAIVGDAGPEVATFPRGARVDPIRGGGIGEEMLTRLAAAIKIENRHYLDGRQIAVSTDSQVRHEQARR